MNKLSSIRLASRAYTLLELVVAMGMLSIVGGAIYTVLNGGLILFSKNIATNHSNLTVRVASLRLIQDIHESVGRPEIVKLVSGNFQTVAQTVGTTVGEGVRFPLLINSQASYIVSSGSNTYSIPTVSPTTLVSLKIPQQTNSPKVGDILILPDIADRLGNTLTRTITAVALGSPTTITVADLGISLNISTNTYPTPPIEPTLIYIARLAAYCVVPTTTATDSDGLPTKTEVRFYPDAAVTANYTVTNTDMTTYLPAGTSVIPNGAFSISTGSTSVTVQLISINSDTGVRKYTGDRLVLVETIPPKCTMLQSNDYN